MGCSVSEASWFSTLNNMQQNMEMPAKCLKNHGRTVCTLQFQQETVILPLTTWVYTRVWMHFL